MHEVDPAAIARLLKPRSIAIVGASADPRSMGGNVLGNLKRAGFAGDLHLVSRTRTEIDGQPCVKSIDDLPTGVDAIVLLVPQEAVLESIQACGRRGIGGAITFASGFAEAGPEGRVLQEKLTAVAHEAGVVVNGPNNLGFINYVDAIPLTFGEYQPMAATKTTGVAVIAQSGAIGSCIRDSLVASGLKVTFLISTGNEAVLSAEDFLEQVLEEPNTGVVTLFVEQIRQPKKLLRLAKRARELKKPIVLMQPGRTESAQKAAQSHTGAFTGDLAVMKTILGNEGVAVVDGLDALSDVALLVATRPIPGPGKTAFMTNSGAVRGLAFDFAQDSSVELAEWTPKTTAGLREIFPPFVTIDNPLDTGTVAFAKPEVMGQSAKLVIDDEGVNSLVISQFTGRPPQQVEKAEQIVPVIRGSQKPVAFVMLGDPMELDPKFMSIVREEGAALFRSTERAMHAMGVVCRLAKRLAHAATAKAAGKPLDTNSLPDGTIAEYRSKELLAGAGVPIPKGGLAKDVAEAEKIAAKIGYPVALKAQAAALAHKSDAGGVILNIGDANALRAAWQKLNADVQKAKPGLVLDGVLVEAMAGKGLELIVGARRDPQWGAVLMLGLGGIWVETLKDVQLLPADASKDAILEALGQLKGAALLRGTRGSAAVDVDAIADVARTVGGLVEQSPEIAELEINPLVAYPEGKGAVALDALIVKAARS